MHAMYCFLFHMNWNARLTKRQIERAADVRFDDAVEPFCDENNWHTHYMAIGQDGKMVILAPDNEYNTGEGSIWAKALAVPSKDRFQWACDWAKRSVEVECETWYHGIYKEVPWKEKDKVLRNIVYSTAISQLRKALADNIDTADGGDIRKIGYMIEQLEDKGSVEPFTRMVVSPYDSIRATEIDFWDQHGDYAVILFTDIHT